MTRKSNDNFIHEYLYIEEYPPMIFEQEHKKKSEKKTDESSRGVEVIVLFGDEE